MMRRHLPLAILLLAAALPAAAQDSIPARWGPFPGIAWGMPEDSVLAVFGAADRRWEDEGYGHLEYADSSDGRPLARTVVLLAGQGVVIAGYRLPFGTDCADQLQAARADIERAFPRLEWEGTPPEPYDCVRRPVRSWINGGDPDSGTRVSVRMNRGDMEMSVYAYSRQVLERMGVRP
jgi:hypothetical protein